MTALNDIAAERRRQDTKWGGADHDDEHSRMEMTAAGIVYALDAVSAAGLDGEPVQIARKAVLPVSPCGHSQADPRRNLVKAAACIVAEIERLDRGDGKTTPTLYRFDDWAKDDQVWDTDTGAPGLHHFAGCVQTWSVMQARPTSVAEAARAFNVDPARVIEAVKAAYWMFLEGPEDDYERLMIEHDGE